MRAQRHDGLLGGHEDLVLAYFMTAPDACREYLHRIAPEVFSDPTRGTIFGAIHDLHDQREKINLITVSNRLAEKRQLKECGGEGRISKIATSTTGREMAGSAIDCMLEDWRQRQVAQIGKQLIAGDVTPVAAERRLRDLNNASQLPETRRRPLSTRTIAEIRAMKFDPADFILANGYATAGDLTAMCGAGGVGKSRLTMQFALCCRSGRDFLGWPTNGRNLRFLFLQTENSCRRLQADLEKMMTAFTPKERAHIDAGIFFHTLEGDDDGFLALDHENKQRVEAVITEIRPDVVVFDPLRDFSFEDLNSDKFMGETLRDILHVTKRGNPKRLPFVIHHAITGKAGVQKITGWDRSSFGRNSKVLLMIARAVINVGPAKQNDNNTLIVGSGKCNNAPEFETFAARLSFDTMLYTRDDDFDIEAWQQEVASAKNTQKPPVQEALRELLKPGREYDKSQIATLIMNDKGVASATAYRWIDQATAGKTLRFNKTIKTYELR
jgi:AAA domain/DnaB-like helicase N terminal domain